MHKLFAALFSALLVFSFPVSASELSDSVKKDYDDYLADLWDHFHRNPELSQAEFKTGARIAEELRAAGFDVTEGVGGTGVVAMLVNGDGPLVMMRADMDGLPVEEKSGLLNASTATQMSPLSGKVEPVMHACGHDVHMTSLVGTARQMAAHKDQWSGTLMLVAQPDEEMGGGAATMRKDGIWERFGTPDYALALHIRSETVAGRINASEGSPYAGVDTVDIIIHGVGAHGASPHRGKDPIVLGSQIVLALQTLVARELAPREAGVVTVGAFHSGTKHNIISDRAHLQLTVRNTNPETRTLLLDGIKRIAENMGRVAGLPEDKLPEVIVSDGYAPPMVNTPQLVRRLKVAWGEALGEDRLDNTPEQSPTVYWNVGGTPAEDFEREAAGGDPVPSHHSPLFKISPEPSVRAGVESTVVALLELMGDQ
jgi:hippurate hydrolase